MRKCLSAILLAALLIAIIPFNGNAVEAETAFDNLLYFEDGSYLVISIDMIQARASGTKTGRKTVEYYSDEDELLWKAVLTGIFVYTDTSAVCTSSSCDVTIYNSAWYVVSKTTGKTGATATAEITMGSKIMGITVNKVPVSIALVCNAGGTLS